MNMTLQKLETEAFIIWGFIIICVLTLASQLWSFGPLVLAYPNDVLFVLLGSECSAFSMLDSAGKGSLCPDHTTETIDLGANAH